MKDLQRGDENQAKIVEMQKEMIQAANNHETETSRLKSQLSISRDASSELRDSLEMKNSLIQNLHIQAKKHKKKDYFMLGLIGILTALISFK